MVRIEDKFKWEIAADGHKYHPATILKESEVPNFIETMKHQTGGGRYGYTLIPCGKCIGCRLDYSAEWANRGYCEAKMHENNYFVTLTYDPDHIHIDEYLEDREGFTWVNEGDWNGNLYPKELTQFIKSLRQKMKRDYGDDGIRFMACGEYGSKGARPHYHIIFFGLNLPAETFFEPQIINKNIYYRNKIIEDIWTKGFSNVGEANWNTISYVARYITKKINGEGSEQLYAANGKIKEFMRVSRMPGIGEPYYQKHKDEIYKNGYITIKNLEGTHKVTPPTYFDDLFKKEHPGEFLKIQRERRQRAENKNRLKAEQTSLFLKDQLEIEERSKETNNIALVRMMEKGSR